MPGVSFSERMHGTFYFLKDVMREHEIAIDLEARVRSLRNPVASVTGRVRAADLTDGAAPIQGTLGLHSLGDRRIPYDLAFAVADKRYRVVGEKDFSWLAPIETLVVLPFTIVCDSEGTWNEIARGTVRENRRDVERFARSLRASPF